MARASSTDKLDTSTLGPIRCPSPATTLAQDIETARNAAHMVNGERDYVLSQSEADAIRRVCAALEDHERVIYR